MEIDIERARKGRGAFRVVVTLLLAILFLGSFVLDRYR
jgi:hypothetical protein